MPIRCTHRLLMDWKTRILQGKWPTWLWAWRYVNLPWKTKYCGNPITIRGHLNHHQSSNSIQQMLEACYTNKKNKIVYMSYQQPNVISRGLWQFPPLKITESNCDLHKQSININITDLLPLFWERQWNMSWFEGATSALESENEMVTNWS